MLYRSFNLLLIVLLFSISISLNHHQHIKNSVILDNIEKNSFFVPYSIPKYNIRKDYYTNEFVSRDRLKKLGLTINKGKELINKKISIIELKKALQCSIIEPDLDGNRGSISLIKNGPELTNESIEMLCTYAESKCFPWINCKSDKNKYKNGEYPKDLTNYITSPYQMKLLRIINGELYMDWPWGIERFIVPDKSSTMIIDILLNIVNDIGDSFFFFGEEVSLLPWYMPFPSFSQSPSLKTIDIPWPWSQSFLNELKLYENSNNNNNKTFDIYEQYHSNNEIEWSNRISKASFYGSISKSNKNISPRHIFFDIASKRPDLIDANWQGDLYSNAWDPLSTDTGNFMNSNEIEEEKKNQKIKSIDKNYNTQIGNINNILKSHIDFKVNFMEMKYKYLIVLTGLGGLASADRLASLISHSGAVILLQESEFSYHFSSRFKPWIHYIPLTITAADVIDKIIWLKNNEKAAYRIASNAKAFGQSYLRLEDYFCYTLTALETVSNLTENTLAAKISFNKKKIKSDWN